TGSIATTPLSRPYRLAWAGSRLWIAYGNCDGSFEDGVASVDLSTKQVRRLPPRHFVGSCPQVLAVPGSPDRLLVSLTPGGLSEYAVSGGRLRPGPTVVAGGLSRGGAVSPDGRYLLVAGNEAQVSSYSLSTLGSSGTEYQAASYVNGVATVGGPQPKVVVGADAIYGPDVWMYRADDSESYRSIDFGS